MKNFLYREATTGDIPYLARIRGGGIMDSESAWNGRIAGYMNYTHHPQHALKPRIIYVATEGDRIIGFAAGHLTRRYACEGELQWINVIEEYQRSGIATVLVRLLADWFVEQQAYKICIDPGNETARIFYRKNGAADLNDHWMVWEDIRTILK